MNKLAEEYLRERGFRYEGLSGEGEFFAVLAAKADEFRRLYEGTDYPQARATVVEFCKALVRIAESPKSNGLGLDPADEKMLVISSLVEVFADREMLERFVTAKP